MAIVIGDGDDYVEIQPAATEDINGEIVLVDDDNNNGGGPSKQQNGPSSGGHIAPAVVGTAVSKRQPTPNPLSPPSDAAAGGRASPSPAQAAKNAYNDRRSNGDLVIINEKITLDAWKPKGKGKEAVDEVIVEEDDDEDVQPAVNLDLTTTPYDEFNQVMRQGPLSSSVIASPSARRKFQPPLSRRPREEVEEEGRKRLAAKIAGTPTPSPQHHHHHATVTGTASPLVPPTIAIPTEQEVAPEDQAAAAAGGGDAQQQAIQRRYVASRLGPYGSTHAAAAPSSGLRNIYNTHHHHNNNNNNKGDC
jgi:hypothetical protein